MGIVFSTQRFSVHDGPGIRTTVFLKGCPMRCLWCHNPESANFNPELGYHKARCTLCSQCVSFCPSGALSVSRDGIVRDSEKCVMCGKCVKVCPTGATEMYGKEMSADEVAETVRRDRKFYERSGGGVTFSGGEPLSQVDFVAECASKLKPDGIHTAVETSLYASRNALDKILPHIDYFMADIKVMDDDIHKKATGCSNRIILENFAYLAKKGAEVLVRIPIIPGINDSSDNIKKTAEFLTENTPYRKIELLPMHKLAEHKYEALGRDYPVKDIPTPPKESLDALNDLLREMGFDTNKK